MSAERALFGLAREHQSAVAIAAGVVLALAGLLARSPANPKYSPLLFGTGVVLILYALLLVTYDRMRAALSSD